MTVAVGQPDLRVGVDHINAFMAEWARCLDRLPAARGAWFEARFAQACENFDAVRSVPLGAFEFECMPSASLEALLDQLKAETLVR